MNIKKRSIISIALIIAMTFSLFAFASCSAGEQEETITVHVTITGPDSAAAPLFDMDVKLTGYPNDLTAAYATQRACDIQGLTYNYDSSANMVVQIGDYINEGTGGAAVTSATDANGNAVTTEATSVAMTGLFWQLLINTVESSSSQKLNDGDKLNWSYVNLPIENK